jgi:hypothetical protein
MPETRNVVFKYRGEGAISGSFYPANAGPEYRIPANA